MNHQKPSVVTIIVAAVVVAVILVVAVVAQVAIALATNHHSEWANPTITED